MQEYVFLLFFLLWKQLAVNEVYCANPLKSNSVMWPMLQIDRDDLLRFFATIHSCGGSITAMYALVSCKNNEPVMYHRTHESLPGAAVVNLIHNVGVVVWFSCRERRHSCGSSRLLRAAQGEGGHQANQPREVPDQYGRALGKR